MFFRDLIIILSIFLVIFTIGCVQQEDKHPVPPPARTIPPTVLPVHTTSAITPQQTMTPEGAGAEPTIREDLTNADTDSDLAIARTINGKISRLQVAKKEVISLFQNGNYDQLEPKVNELLHSVRNSDDIGEIPAKMDYLRVSYYQYVDQMQQFAESFSSAIKKRQSKDNSSANSYFDAGMISSGRADLYEKQIHTFLKGQFPGDNESFQE